MKIEPGTLCYLVHLVDPAFNGLTVEVMSAAEPKEDGALWHVIDAAWVRALYGEHTVVTAQPRNLLPIAGRGGDELIGRESGAVPQSTQIFARPG